MYLHLHLYTLFLSMFYATTAAKPQLFGYEVTSNIRGNWSDHIKLVTAKFEPDGCKLERHICTGFHELTGFCVYNNHTNTLHVLSQDNNSSFTIYFFTDGKMSLINDQQHPSRNHFMKYKERFDFIEV